MRHFLSRTTHALDDASIVLSYECDSSYSFRVRVTHHLVCAATKDNVIGRNMAFGIAGGRGRKNFSRE
jgi:hypothetical protein